MGVPLSEIRELSRDELIELVAELRELAPGTRSVIVEPGDEIKVDVKGDVLEVLIPETHDDRFPDIDASVDILVIQEFPYVELECIHVRDHGKNDVINDNHFRVLSHASSGYKIRTTSIVTTGTVELETIDERLYHGEKVVDGAELCDWLVECADYGFDFDDYF